MISREEVEHIARLARLNFAGEELERFRHDLSRIIDYVQILGELELSCLPPTAHAVEVKNVLRPDVPRPCLSQEAAVVNGPAVDAGQFLVPRIG
ncbi:MAG: Asp-tRNA(Asn)/Glu-tRNA(Gln) amidotransferase subunit GatC [Thermoleophilia bacterium]